MARGIRLVARGLAVVTRSNRFMLKQLEGKSIPAAISWDEGQHESARPVGLIEPSQQ